MTDSTLVQNQTTLIYATSANVGDTVSFHARGKVRTGLILEVKGVKALVAFAVTPNARYNDDGAREQWIRFDRPATKTAKTTGKLSSLAQSIRYGVRNLRSDTANFLEEQAEYEAAKVNPASALAEYEAYRDDFNHDHPNYPTKTWTVWSDATRSFVDDVLTLETVQAKALASYQRAADQQSLSARRLQEAVDGYEAAGGDQAGIQRARAKGEAQWTAEAERKAQWAAESAANRRAGK